VKRKSKRRRRKNKILWVLMICMGIRAITICATKFTGKRKDRTTPEEVPILSISMVEDVKGRGGSGYVVGKDKQVLESWLKYSFDNNDSVSTECIAEILSDIYEEAVDTNTLGSLDMMRRMVARLGENGYVAVDSGNQIDMTQAEQAFDFCKAVDEKEMDELTIIVVFCFFATPIPFDIL